ncbi:hypothetical protein pEaSNUABM13_00288 [Erwinia phage pEa_SNUABM_13]|nr:hypothetical protein pEaSNUABM13_00288 [Erwinia phage pEa_SNUABM_13]QYW05641.1 hypothetical protein pEaSNUABM25_00285 [Erwinia phage pEa_SNUABM_25]
MEEILDVDSKMYAVYDGHVVTNYHHEGSGVMYIEDSFWLSLNLRDDLFPAPPTRLAHYKNVHTRSIDRVRVSTIQDIRESLYKVRHYIRWFEYISEDKLQGLQHLLREPD